MVLALAKTNSVVTFGLLAPLAILGVWVTRTQWRTVWLLYALVISLGGAWCLAYLVEIIRRAAAIYGF